MSGARWMRERERGLVRLRDGAATNLFDVGLSLCAMASLGLCITAALWSIRLL